ncbi:integrase [Salmonella enterica]|nr:integrase [Salmonella enterica]
MRKYITGNEWVRFFNAISGTKNEIRDKAMFNMMYMHGLRVSELINMNISDLDIPEKTVFVKRLKNGLSTSHPLQRETLLWLKKWIHIRFFYDKNCANEKLFISTSGKQLSRQWLYRLCIRFGQRAGLSIRVHPHMLRHACGYALANQGLDTRLIQDYLGHRNIHHTVLYTASNFNRFSRVWNDNRPRKGS